MAKIIYTDSSNADWANNSLTKVINTINKNSELFNQINFSFEIEKMKDYKSYRNEVYQQYLKQVCKEEGVMYKFDEINTFSYAMCESPVYQDKAFGRCNEILTAITDIYLAASTMTFIFDSKYIKLKNNTAQATKEAINEITLYFSEVTTSTTQEKALKELNDILTAIKEFNKKYNCNAVSMLHTERILSQNFLSQIK